MTNGGDAAEQVVRLSLEGFEVAARLTGSAAKNVAILLASVLKQEATQANKTRGKARLTNMIKSGKELKVFSIPNRDLKKFTEHTQFLVITHRKGTMEAADSVYGVTMEESGISKLLSMKLKQ